NRRSYCYPIKLADQSWQSLGGRNGGTCGSGYQIGSTGPTHSKVLFGGAVYNVLRCGISMNRCHDGLLNPNPTVQDFYYWTNIVGGTAGTGKYRDFTLRRIHSMNYRGSVLTFGRG